MDAVIQFFDALHPAVLYSVLGLGAALENFIPPVPADTFVLLGGFLASAGTGEPALVFLATWVCNVAAALYVYHLGHVHGRPFFEHGWGRRLISHHQLEALGRFYTRWGTLAIFVTRFLPGFRAVVPVFAGVTHRRWVEVVPPIAVASGIWYGVLVWIGAMTQQNLESILGWLSSANRVLLLTALVLGLVLSLVWYRTRHPNGSDGDS